MGKTLFCLSILLSSYLLHAQTTVTGVIKDLKTNLPLQGVSIKLKSGKSGTVTNANGEFKMTIHPGDTLEISNIGYKAQTLVVGAQSGLSIMLEPSSSELSEIVFVGSRGAGRAKTETPVPVDIIHISQVSIPTAKMDLTSVLNYSAPSFNYNKQSGADGADQIDLGTLRGLGPDQTLVLINGKRRHQTAFVALFGTRGRGNSGVDLNAFPEAAVDRVEILRDGASAQYGSDAIAGVINIILKKDINHWTIKGGWSGYYDTKFNSYQTRATNDYYYSHPIDGGSVSLSADNGFALGTKGGFIHISVDFLNQAKTFRQVPDTNVTTNPKALPLNNLRRAFGDGSLTSGGAMYNMEIPMGPVGRTTFYSFGGYNYKASDAYAYTRNSDDPSRFPVDGSGNIMYDPRIMHQSKTDGTIYYNPHIQTHISDASFAFGFRGDLGDQWLWDFSNTIGRNDFHFFGDKTYNASLGSITPNHFDDGGFNFLQNTANLDFNKSFKSLGEGLNLALGAEYRYERYAIYSGEEASWKQYPNSTGQAAGSQGFPGFRPADDVKADRSNIGAYVEAELNVTRRWLLDLAVRFENYSDFGFVNTSKLATRYKITDNFNVRGSVSTGYRAPSLQQINFSNTLTTFVGNVLEEEKVARNDDPITKAAGIPNLKQETSINGSIGFSWKPVNNLTVTVDGYIVKVKDRVVLSGLFSASDTTLPPELTSQLQSLNVALAQFFANAVNTTNFGLDVVVDYNKRWGNKGFKLLFAGNIQNMRVDSINVPPKLNDSYLHRKTFFSDREEAFLKASAPKSKFSLNLEYSVNKFAVGGHFTYFGDVKLLGFGWTGPGVPGSGLPGDPDISGSFTGIDPYVTTEDGNSVVPEVFDYKPKLTTDLYVSYKFSKHISLFLGADNVFNVHPDYGVVPNARYAPGVGNQSFDNESGGPWDSVQMGFDGRRLFGKVVLNL
ncbi:MAG TPA: TonB-dependent receptor [Puia sp.]|nr:TonB-dependent receptor [Puia sp.]